MIAAKSGFIADFKTGYLQKADIIHQCAVTGGTDTNSGRTGFAVGRLVKITSGVMAAATNVSATSIGDATHIVAQSDDSLRNIPSDAIKTDMYTTRNSNILANTVATGVSPDLTNIEHGKSVAVYKIVNADDIKIIPVAPATNSVVR